MKNYSSDCHSAAAVTVSQATGIVQKTDLEKGL